MLKDKIFLFLTFAASISALAALPYIFSQIPTEEDLPLPLPLIIGISFIQSTLYFGLMVFAGLRIYKKSGFQLPVLERWTNGESIAPALIKITRIAPLIGLFTFGIIALGDFIFYKLGSDLSIYSIKEPAWWKALLASFYGGFAEEIMVRFFMMTGIVWVLTKIIKPESQGSRRNIILLSILIAALIFGVLHLPATAQLTGLTTLVVIRALLLNGIPGIIFGLLYWKKGLEYAIATHFFTDIFLHVLFPIFTN